MLGSVRERLLIPLDAKLHDTDSVLLTELEITFIAVLGAEVNERFEFERFEKAVIQ